MGDRTLNLAHRGASAWAPENTLAAFRLAVEMGADGFELDVQLTSDDQPIVIHDRNVRRTTDGHGRVDQLTLSEIKQFDAGSWFNTRRPSRARPEYAGEQVPTLAETLELAQLYRSVVYIELKFYRDSRPGVEDHVARQVRDYDMAGQVMIESFNHDALRRIKELAPEIQTAALFGRSLLTPGLSAPRLVQLAWQAKADEVALHKSLISKRLLGVAAAAGLSAVAWTINGRPLMRRGLRLGLKGIITNYPDKLTAVLNEPPSSLQRLVGRRFQRANRVEESEHKG